MYGARTTDRYSSDFLNERENFFHKPLVNLNHFYDINDDIRLSSVFIGVVVQVVEQVHMVVLVENLLSKEKLGTQVHLGCGIGMLKLLRTHLM